MMMYNQETKDIAKPSELLNGIKAIMSVLQSIENYGKHFFFIRASCGYRGTAFLNSKLEGWQYLLIANEQRGEEGY